MHVRSGRVVGTYGGLLRSVSADKASSLGDLFHSNPPDLHTQRASGSFPKEKRNELGSKSVTGVLVG